MGLHFNCYRFFIVICVWKIYWILVLLEFSVAKCVSMLVCSGSRFDKCDHFYAIKQIGNRIVILPLSGKPSSG